MKKISFSILLLFVSTIILAQTNIFPSSGNVGIGVYTPQYKLDVNGKINANDILIDGQSLKLNFPKEELIIKTSNSVTSGRLHSVTHNWVGLSQNLTFNGGNSFKLDNSTLSAWALKLDTRQESYGDAFEIWRFPTGDMNQVFDESNIMFKINSLGNVGFGTDSPSEKLDINGSIRLNNSGNKIYWDWSSRSIEQYSSDGNSRMIRFRNSMDQSNPDGGFDFATHDGVSILRINQGKVGIGTNDFSGNHKLRVEGSIGAREIKVEATGWSDFVFERDYDLRTLEEVEEHIAEKGHLPEIPSEAEVTENGINLGEMDAKLLQKIEELTLYMIKQNKQNLEQQKLIEQLQREVSALKKN